MQNLDQVLADIIFYSPVITGKKTRSEILELLEQIKKWPVAGKIEFLQKLVVEIRQSNRSTSAMEYLAQVDRFLFLEKQKG